MGANSTMIASIASRITASPTPSVFSGRFVWYRTLTSSITALMAVLK
jgi:hypothetical protein